MFPDKRIDGKYGGRNLAKIHRHSQVMDPVNSVPAEIGRIDINVENACLEYMFAPL